MTTFPLNAWQPMLTQTQSTLKYFLLTVTVTPKITDSVMCMMPFKDSKLRQMVLKLFIDIITRLEKYSVISNLI